MDRQTLGPALAIAALAAGIVACWGGIRALPPLPMDAVVVGAPVAEDDGTMLVQVTAQGSSRASALFAAYDAAVRACLADEYSHYGLQQLRTLREWESALDANTVWVRNPRYTPADSTLWARSSTHVEGQLRVMVEQLREWIAATVDLEWGPPFSPPPICVAYLTDDGKYVEQRMGVPLKTEAMGGIGASLRDRGAEVMFYATKLQAVRAEPHPALAYGIDERHCIPAEVLLACRITVEDRPSGLRTYTCSLTARSSLTGDVWALQTGHSDAVDDARRGIRQACESAVDAIWDDMAERYRQQRQRGALYRIVCDCTHARRADAADIMLAAQQELSDDVHVVLDNGQWLATEMWVPLDRNDPDQIAYLLNRSHAGGTVLTRTRHASRNVILLECD